MKLLVNMIIAWIEEESIKKTERILWIGEEMLVVADINSNDSPYQRTIIEVEEAFRNGTVKEIEHDPSMIVMSEDEIPMKYKEIRDKSWDIIKDLVNSEPQVFQPSWRRRKVKEVAIKYAVSEASVFRYLKKYWKRGMCLNSLLPDFFNCGGIGRDRATSDAKKGRPRKYPDITGQGINVTEDIKTVFRKAINRFYYTRAKNSLVLTYELMRKEYFNQGYKEEKGVKIPILKPESSIPSFGQFRYFFEKERNIKKEISSRYSNKKFQKQYRAITGNAMQGVFEPGNIEIDCQVADVYLVSRFNRNWIIGRPCLYICIDRFSQYICGMYVGLESGSYIGASMAIMNMVSNKVSFCKKYGVEISEEDWSWNALPLSITADRGELEGKGIEDLVNTLGVTIHNSPPYRADWKSSVERFFGLSNDRTKPFLPGVVDLDGRERADADYRVKAKLDLRQFTKIIIKCILFHNNHYYLDNYSRDEFMIQDEIPCIPSCLLSWGIANRGGALKNVSEDVAKLVLMPKDSGGVITGKGIRFRGMYFASKSMLKEQTFVKARTRGTSKVKLSYDPRNLNVIYVWGDKPNAYEQCFLIDGQNRYENKTIEEIDYLLSMEKIQGLSNSEMEAQAKAQLATEIEDIVKHAEDDYRKEPDGLESDTQRVKNIRENRKLEKTANRLKEAFVLNNQLSEFKDNQVPVEVDGQEDHLEWLFKKQKEGLAKTHGADIKDT